MSTSESHKPEQAAQLLPLSEMRHFKIPTFRILRVLLDAIPDSAMILDADRRIIMANAVLLRVFELSPENIIGHKPGDALGCLFSEESPKGCGSGIHCTVCGALRSILLCQEIQDQAVQECQILLGDAEQTPLDVEVTATYAVIDEMPVTLFVMRDVSAEKRRSVLERLFFHDVINTVGGIHGLAELLNGGIQHLTSEQEQEYHRWILDLSKKLINEILHQRKLMAAERGEFKPELGIVSVEDLLADVHALYSSHDVAEGRILRLGEVCRSNIISDPQILMRILGNLVKNALEATSRGGTVTLSCVESGDDLLFSVHNPGVMPRDVQLQLFRRSFSTKDGSGRGMGTYSVKLFGEKYLKGKIAFTSRDPEGTTFTFTLPKTVVNSPH